MKITFEKTYGDWLYCYVNGVLVGQSWSWKDKPKFDRQKWAHSQLKKRLKSIHRNLDRLNKERIVWEDELRQLTDE